MTCYFNFPKVIGHRGAKGHAPENTLASFRKAHELGATWVEFDVQETKDGQLIVMHDDTLNRTTNYPGIVLETNWEIIDTLDAGSWYSPQFKGEKIPSLQEAVVLFDVLKLGMNLEIKPSHNYELITAKRVAKFIKNKWSKSLQLPLVSSFNLKSLEVAKIENPDLLIGLLFENNLPDDWKIIAKYLQPVSIHLEDAIVTQRLVESIKNEGYEVLVYTVNSKNRGLELFKMGVSSVFSDYPDLFNRPLA